MRIALFISGGGTTAEHIIRSCSSGELEGVTPALVVSSRAEAAGIARAKAAGVNEKNVVVARPSDFRSEAEFGEALLRECRKRGVDFIGQYGWLAHTPLNLIEAYEKMIVNQHPGPLDPGRPDFGGKGMFGMRVHCARIIFVDRVERDYWSEATSHRVAEEYDKGSLLKAAPVPIYANDTPEKLAARMLPVEHLVQVDTIRDFAKDEAEEMIRKYHLVLGGEEPILAQAKADAIALYPNG